MSNSRHKEALRKFAEGTFIPAIPLALDANRRFDESTQRLLLRYYLEAGAGGIAVAVHTTQFQIRETGLLEPVLRVTGEEIGRFEAEIERVVVRIAGACGPCDQAVAEAELARKLGYDAVLLSPGGLAGLTEDQLLERTRAVAKILPVIGFYLQAAVGGRTFSYDYWQQLCEIENMVGIKCASFDRYSTIDAVRAAALASREVTLYTGNDDNIVVDLLTSYRFTVDGQTVTKQFVGGLLGQWAMCARTAVKLFHTVKEAALKPQIPRELLSLAAELTDFNSAVFDARNSFKGCIPGVHEVLCRQGLLHGGWCLDPDEVLSQGQAEEIARVMEMYPRLCDHTMKGAGMSNAELTKEKILEAAESEFAAKGLYGARVDEIAALAKVNKQIMYTRFGSKEQLYTEVLVRVYSRLTSLEEQLRLDESDCVQAVRDIVAMYFDFLSRDQHFVKLVLWENLNEARYIQGSDVQPIKDHAVGKIRRVLEAGIRRGVFRVDVDIEETILSLNMFAFSYFSNIHTMTLLMHDNFFSPARIQKRADYVAGLLLDSIVKKDQ